MSRIYERFSTSGFDTYQDFYKYFKLCIPEDFNFAYDVVDELAETKPYKCALLWTNLEGEVKTFTFADLKRLSNKAANFFTKAGIQKGDKVMLILKRRYEFWISMLAISKIGAVAIPATHLLTKKDIVYRNNKAGVRAIIATDSEEIVEHVDASMPESSTLAVRIIVGGKREGWLNFEEGLQAASSKFARIPTSAEDMMLAFFSSGTTGMPKLVAHNHKYPLAHIPTAVYWHNVDPEGIHLTVSDTGWGKCVWGKLYGQLSLIHI